MKEAFEIMGEHWMVTFWLGIIILGVAGCLTQMNPIIRITNNKNG